MKLQLYYPVKPISFSQMFGGNGTWYQNNGIDVKGHNGLDFRTDRGQIVRASHDGTAYVGIDSKEGHGVVIRTNEKFEYGDKEVFFKTIYWHLLPNIPVKNGQQVKTGDIIGYADSTGFSTGDHLHFGLKPQTLNEPDNVWYNIEQDNGYFGAIDPLPYFNNFYAEDVAKVTIIQSLLGLYKKLLEALLKKSS